MSCPFLALSVDTWQLETGRDAPLSTEGQEDFGMDGSPSPQSQHSFGMDGSPSPQSQRSFGVDRSPLPESQDNVGMDMLTSHDIQDQGTDPVPRMEAPLVLGAQQPSIYPAPAQEERVRADVSLPAKARESFGSHS